MKAKKAQDSTVDNEIRQPVFRQENVQNVFLVEKDDL